MVSGSFSLPCSGFFSPFPHGTGSLSVSQEYLALADGPARFTQGFTCPALLRIPLSLTLLACTGLSPSTAPLSKGFQFVAQRIPWSYNPNIAGTTLVWTNPISLATTLGISVDFCSSAYLDVSVQRVRSCKPMYSAYGDPCGPGFPIRISADQCSFASSPQLFAGCHVLHRL